MANIMKKRGLLSDGAPAPPQKSPEPSSGKRTRAREKEGKQDEGKRKLLRSTVELLRDHPVFAVPDPDGQIGAQADAKPMAPHDREREWEIETLRLFKRRTGLVTAVAMSSLPFFWAVYSYFAPDARLAIAMAHLWMFSCCAALHIAARRLSNLRRLRLVSMCAYIVYGLTASVVMAAARNLNVILFSGHEQIIVSLLFVPFALPESAFCALTVVAAYAVGLSVSLPVELDFTLASRIASLFFLSGLIVIMSHLQNLVRRRAFDVSFDMAMSASRGAALSSLDAVTGGFNRRHLFNMLELELARVTRFEQPLGLVMFDLDNFKAVNDANGHLAGDEVLRVVLDAAGQTLRGLDTIARYGGDEFVIVLPGADAQSAYQTAERVRACVLSALQNRFAPDSLESRVTLSLGAISVDAAHPLSVEAAIEAADAQLYKAKRGGKNRVYAG